MLAGAYSDTSQQKTNNYPTYLKSSKIFNILIFLPHFWPFRCNTLQNLVEFCSTENYHSLLTV